MEESEDSKAIEREYKSSLTSPFVLIEDDLIRYFKDDEEYSTSQKPQELITKDILYDRKYFISFDWNSINLYDNFSMKLIHTEEIPEEYTIDRFPNIVILPQQETLQVDINDGSIDHETYNNIIEK